MQTIEINTTQNVVIDYQLAGLSHRIFAFLIDLAIIVFSASILFKILAENILSIEITAVFIVLYVLFYPLLSEILGDGQSVGKKIMGIKVIKINGDELEFYDYFSRWALTFIDIYFSFGSIASIMIVSNRNGQRIGDIIAGTTIIKKNSSFGFQLNDILKLNNKDKDSYEFSYPLAKNLEEKDVLLIKNLIYRNRIYNNSAHNEALDILVKRIAEVVDEHRPQEDKEAFLNKVMTEYIILTR
ncbi:MAG: RDD family protein [Bacteroidia bacterium]|nr:RDD family protein [Bacteroidia bacterium]